MTWVAQPRPAHKPWAVVAAFLLALLGAFMALALAPILWIA